MLGKCSIMLICAGNTPSLLLVRVECTVNQEIRFTVTVNNDQIHGKAYVQPCVYVFVYLYIYIQWNLSIAVTIWGKIFWLL